ncbi:MAG: hypothetical protein L6Q98_21550 [Anaerolineae bacterium]|nr:hypothetical protein [Anaerolineae bacterium]NUQ05512.1 hypothetical protein [Anaerolineae bacterium]
MPNQINPTIVSLAILKINWENKKDYLDIFVPLVAETIRLSHEDIVTAPTLQEEVRAKFGLVIPQNTLKTILNRVRKNGYIRLENRIYYCNREALRGLEDSFYQVQQNVLRAYEDLVYEFTEFCANVLQVSISVEESDSIFQEYLRENALILKGQNGGTVIPSAQERPSKSRRFYIGAFVQHLETTHSSHFASWETIVIGNMLANSVYLPDTTHANRRFQRTSVYFDTSFLIYALGYAGDARKAPCEELLNLLYEVGADLKCFKHTVDEVRGILSACANKIRQGQLKDAYGPSIEYFLLKGFSATDIELYIVQLERDLQSVRIAIVDKPNYREHEYVIDEVKLREALSAELYYFNPDGQALDRDVDSIAAILRLRQGRMPNLIEDCGNVFVTTNSGLARISRNFSFDQRFPDSISPCITDDMLTTILWLKNPHQAANLPRKRIIADYYAAVQPDITTIKQYNAEIEKLSQGKAITQNDYYLLRYSSVAKNGLMQVTHGGEEAVTNVTVKEVLDIVYQQLRDEDRQKLEQEIRQREASRLETEGLRNAEIQRVSRIKSRAQKWASSITKYLRYIVIFLLGVATITTFPWNLPALEEAIPQYAFTVLWLILFVLSMINLLFGTPVEEYIRRFESRLFAEIERVMLGLGN